MTIKDTHYNNRSSTYKNFKSILDFVKNKTIAERKKLILEIQIDNYFDFLETCEVVIDE